MNAAEAVMEYMFLYFISIYLSNYLKIDGSSNTNLIALIGIFYIVGRGLNVIISTAYKNSATLMLYINIVLLLAGSVLILYIDSKVHSTLIAVALILIGLGFSSTLPSKFCMLFVC